MSGVTRREFMKATGIVLGGLVNTVFMPKGVEGQAIDLELDPLSFQIDQELETIKQEAQHSIISMSWDRREWGRYRSSRDKPQSGDRSS